MNWRSPTATFLLLFSLQSGAIGDWPIASGQQTGVVTDGAGFNQAQNELRYAKQKYEQYQQLYREGALSRQELEEAQAQYQLAIANDQMVKLRSQVGASKPSPSQQREQQKAELALAAAQVQLAELQLNRYQQLYQRGAIAKIQLEDARTRWEQAKAKYAALLKKKP